MLNVRKTPKPTAAKLLLYGTSGCIDGDAEIRIRTNYYTGRMTGSVKLKNLHHRFNGEVYVGWRGEHTNEDLEARCINEETGEFEWTPITDVYYSGEKETFKISTANFSVISTKSHKFWTPDGWKELKDIKVGDLVGVSTTASVRTGKHQIRSKEVMVKYHPTASHKIVNGCEYCRLSEHRLAYEANANGLTPEEYRELLNNYDGRDIKVVPRGMEVHHKNGDHYDNRPENLEILSKRDHALQGAEQSKLNLKSVQSVVFQEVVSIEPVGVRPTYDIKCADPYHSFIANNFVVHNSGKTSLAAKIGKNPIILDVENGANYIDCAVIEHKDLNTVEKFYGVLKELFVQAKTGKLEYDNIVIDSIDEAVRMLEAKMGGAIDSGDMKQTIYNGEGSYGNGKKFMENEIRLRLLKTLDLFTAYNVSVTLVAHANMKKLMDSEGNHIDTVSPKMDEYLMNLFVEHMDFVYYLKNVEGERRLVLESDGVVLAKNRIGKTGEVSLKDTDINDLLTIKKEK